MPTSELDFLGHYGMFGFGSYVIILKASKWRGSEGSEKSDGLLARQHKFPAPGVVAWDRCSCSARKGEAFACSTEGVLLFMSFFWDQGLSSLSLPEVGLGDLSGSLKP